MGKGFLGIQKIFGIISGIIIILFVFSFNRISFLLHLELKPFTHLGMLLLLVGGVNMILVFISYFRKTLKPDTLIGIRVILFFIGRLSYFFKDIQENYSFFCMYLYFGIITCISTLLSMGFKLTYKKEYINIIILIVALLQAILLFRGINTMSLYATATYIRILIIWLGINVVLLSFMSFKSKS